MVICSKSNAYEARIKTLFVVGRVLLRNYLYVLLKLRRYRAVVGLREKLLGVEFYDRVLTQKLR